MLFKPLLAFIGYIAASLLINILGPWKYKNFNHTEVLLFMTVFLGLVALGYAVGVRTKVKVPSRVVERKRILFYYSVAIVLVILVKMLVFKKGYEDTPNINILGGFMDLGNIYKSALETKRLMLEQETSYVVQLDTLMAIVTHFVLVLGFYYFSEFPKALKALFLSLLALILSTFLLFRGTQVIIGNLFIYWASVKVVMFLRSGTPLLNRKIVLASLGVMVVFLFMQMSRMDAYDFGMSSFTPDPLLELDRNHLLFKVLGTDLGFPVALMLMYVSMGYYGLSLSFSQPFVWTYGVGNSFALTSYAAQYFQMEHQAIFTFPLRVEAATGWPALMYWHTAFPWLASDLTMPGTLIFLGLVAYLYGRCFKEAVLHNNLLSLALFAQLNILWLFIPANNQLMQTRESTLTTILLVVFWVIFHKKFNGPKNSLQCAPE